jgi:hypothetical protein
MASFGAAFAVSGGAHNPNKDLEVPQPPSDGISSLSFSPVANHLVATSWDSQVRCWEVSASGQAVAKAATAHEQPVLCSAWSADGTTVFTGAPSPPHDPGMCSCAACELRLSRVQTRLEQLLTAVGAQWRRQLRQDCQDVEPADQPEPGGGAA